MLAMRRRMRPVLVEFPVLVAIAAKPVSAIVVPFVGEAHGDAVVGKAQTSLIRR